MRYDRRAGAAPAVAAAAVAITALSVTWAGLTDAGSAGRLGALGLLAALGALATLLPRWQVAGVVLAAVAAPLGALALATHVPLWDLVRLDGEAWSAVRAVLPEGLRQASDAPLPASREQTPALVALLLLCLWSLCAIAAWQLIVRRLPLGALVVLAVGVGYRWTVEPPADEVRAGVLALVAVVAILALSSWRGASPGAVTRRAIAPIAMGAGAAAVAVAVAAGPVGGGDGWWDWRDWRFEGTAARGPAALDLRQRYGQLDRSREPRVVLAVRTERALPLRAAVLEDFDGEAFAQARARQPDVILAVRDGQVALGQRQDGAPVVDERIRVLDTTSGVLIAPGRPVAVAGLPDGRVELRGDTIGLGTALRRGDQYAVRSSIPDTTARELSDAEPYRQEALPAESTRLRPHLWGPPVDVPAWGTGGSPPSDDALGAHAPVRDLAREVVGDAPTAYAAVVRIEAHLRRGYAYDEAPPQPSQAGTPAINEFLFGSRRGFCQHFAGAMGVMLRSLGIPARVAVGYTPGRYDGDAGVWVVDDRDAHSWVEVWFPEYGWLPFDPTPGRSAPTPASVSSPSYDPPGPIIGAGGLIDPGLPEPDPDPPAQEPAEPEPADPVDPVEPDPQAVAGDAGDAGGGGRGAWWAALAAVVVAGAGASAWPAARRARARRRGDGRMRVGAAITDLERSAARAGAAIPASAAPGERARLLAEGAGVDARAFYRRTAVARFGAAEPAPGEVAWAWRESARLRRDLRRAAPWHRRLRAGLAPRATVRT